MTDSEIVTITAAEYDALLSDSRQLATLLADEDAISAQRAAELAETDEQITQGAEIDARAEITRGGW